MPDQQADDGTAAAPRAHDPTAAVEAPADTDEGVRVAPDPDAATTADVERDRRRRRVPVRVLLLGAAASFVLSLVLGVAGVPGAVAGAVFVALLSLVSGIAGSILAIGVVVDQFRGRHVSGARVALTGLSMLLTLLLLVGSAGAFVGAAESLS